VTIDNETTIKTYKTGCVYLKEGWYEYETLEELIELSKRNNERLIMELRESKTK
jgi:hypothetical protein